MKGKKVLFVGAGRHQRRAILRAKELGLEVVAVDRNPEALGLAVADFPEVVDFVDVAGVTTVAKRHAVDGVLTISADRAVPVVAAVAEALGLPGIGPETSIRMTNKLAMRQALEAANVAQPRFATLRSLDEAPAAAEAVGFPAVLKPVDSGGQRGLFRIESLDQLRAHLPEALAESNEGGAIVERYYEGLELNGIAIVRGEEVIPLTLSDRLRPPGVGFGVGWMHVYPASLQPEHYRRAEEILARSIQALGLRNAIAFPQLLICDEDGEARVVEVAARIPGGQMGDLVRHAVGIDLVEVQLRLALGEALPDELVLPRFSQPLAIRFFTARPGTLPTGRVTRIGSLEPLLEAAGVVQAETYLALGETIRPVRVDGDRRGYVIATAESSAEAVRRAEEASRLLEVEVEVAPPTSAAGA